MAELKPCPFCGKEARLQIEKSRLTNKIAFWVDCSDSSDGLCPVLPKTGVCETEEEAINMWNTRKNIWNTRKGE